MPLFFDATPALRMDAGLRFDSSGGSTGSPNLKRSRRMPKFKLELTKKKTPEKIALAQAHIAAMTGNADFPTAGRLPADAAFQTTLDDLIAADAAATAARTALKQALEVRDAKELLLEVALNSRAAYCEAAQPANDAALAGTGLPLKSAPSPVGDLSAPSGLEASMGDHPGEVDLQWDAVYGAGSYEIECMEHGVPIATWQAVKTVTRSRHTVEGLVTGKQYAFRVRAVGPKGPSPWSDEAVKMAP